MIKNKKICLNQKKAGKRRDKIDFLDLGVSPRGLLIDINSTNDQKISNISDVEKNLLGTLSFNHP